MSDTMNGKPAALPIEFLFHMIGDDAVGERNKFDGPMGGRYMSTPTGGGTLEGPRIRGTLVQGFSWAPHRMKRGMDYGHLQYDARVLIQTEDGHRILGRWHGTNSPTYADGSWRVGAVFEAENGPYAWLNGVVAIGVGRKDGPNVDYRFYAVTA